MPPQLVDMSLLPTENPLHIDQVFADSESADKLEDTTVIASSSSSSIGSVGSAYSVSTSVFPGNIAVAAPLLCSS